MSPRASDAAGGLARPLLRWFRRHRRSLPWRRDRDPYRIWVAEVLLQQTRVAHALPYFERFVTKFPSVDSLARAPLSRVLKSWEGAGYYARARHLHEAARRVVADLGGELPRSSRELESLPGFGPYIASAVASLAFDEPVVALEANGLRVGARLTASFDDIRRPRTRAAIRRFWTEELDRRSPGAFNEALMELGETVCLPRRPRCSDCPISAHCQALSELPDPGVLPRRGPTPRKPHVVASVVGVERSGRWLVQQRPLGGLLGGLWELPGGKLRPGESPEVAARREVEEETGVVLPSPLEPVGVIRHAYSHFSVELHLFHTRVPERRPAGARFVPRRAHQRWLTWAQFARLPRPAATIRAVERLRSVGVAKGRASPG